MVMIYGIVPMPAAVFGLHTIRFKRCTYEFQTGTGGNTANILISNIIPIAHLGGAAVDFLLS